MKKNFAVAILSIGLINLAAMETQPGIKEAVDSFQMRVLRQNSITRRDYEKLLSELNDYQKTLEKRSATDKEAAQELSKIQQYKNELELMMQQYSQTPARRQPEQQVFYKLTAENEDLKKENQGLKKENEKLKKSNERFKELFQVEKRKATDAGMQNATLQTQLHQIASQKGVDALVNTLKQQTDLFQGQVQKLHTDLANSLKEKEGLKSLLADKEEDLRNLMTLQLENVKLRDQLNAAQEELNRLKQQ